MNFKTPWLTFYSQPSVNRHLLPFNLTGWICLHAVSCLHMMKIKSITVFIYLELCFPASWRIQVQYLLSYLEFWGLRGKYPALTQPASNMGEHLEAVWSQLFSRWLFRAFLQKKTAQKWRWKQWQWVKSQVKAPENHNREFNDAKKLQSWRETAEFGYYSMWILWLSQFTFQSAHLS